MSRSTVADAREDLRTAADELTAASHLHSAVHELQQKRARGAGADEAAATDAFETFLRPGPGRSPADRRRRLAFLRRATVTVDDGSTTDFFAAARAYVGDASDTSAGGTDLGTLLGDVEGFLSGDDRDRAVATFDALVLSGSRPVTDHLARLTSLLVDAAEGHRDSCRDRLNNTYPDDASGGETIGETGAKQAYVDSLSDTVAELADDQPLALLPVRLETRFVGPDRAEVDDGRELWVRVYPDRVHHDGHEAGLTDREFRWGRNFWAHLWLATHETIDDDAIDRSYLATNLPADVDDELLDVLLDVDPDSFPADPSERKDAIKERAWSQLLERFGRERAAYLVHELEPTGWQSLLDTDTVVPNDAMSGTLQASNGALAFPTVDRKPETLSEPPVARLLPDHWTVYGVWEHADSDRTFTFTVRSNATREPLPVGPTPEAKAVAERYGPDETDRDGGSSDRAVDDDADVAWITNFGEAERAGMAVRIRDQDVFEGPVPSGVDGLADGVFRTLIVTGVAASRTPDEAATELESLFDAHHYTEGLELLERGTPTNNYDTSSGYSSADDPRQSMATECSPPLVERGSNADGDLLSRALGIDPATTGSDRHVFGHVAGADNDFQTRAWHANSALWSGTLGYYLQNMLTEFGPPEPDDASPDPSSATAAHEWTEILDVDLRENAGWYEATRRHFVNYVRGQGPLPAFRAGTQPYGVLPVTPTGTDRDSPLQDTRDMSTATAAGPNPGTSSVDTPPESGGDADDGASDDGTGLHVDPTTWSTPTTEDVRTDRSPAQALSETSDDEFRRRYSAQEAYGAVPDERLAELYPPSETATVFSKAELARHYDPETAATVLSDRDVARLYGTSDRADVDDVYGGDGR